MTESEAVKALRKSTNDEDEDSEDELWQGHEDLHLLSTHWMTCRCKHESYLHIHVPVG